jgi:hypothetical protein
MSPCIKLLEHDGSIVIRIPLYLDHVHRGPRISWSDAHHVWLEHHLEGSKV